MTSEKPEIHFHPPKFVLNMILYLYISFSTLLIRDKKTSSNISWNNWRVTINRKKTDFISSKSLKIRKKTRSICQVTEIIKSKVTEDQE